MNYEAKQIYIYIYIKLIKICPEIQRTRTGSTTLSVSFADFWLCQISNRFSKVDEIQNKVGPQSARIRVRLLCT